MQVKAKCKMGQLGWGQIVELDWYMDAKLRAHFCVLLSREWSKAHIHPESEEKEGGTGVEADKF